MEYSIKQLSDLSGATTRALRWYDSIGLLKTSRVADSGYRYYGPAEVDRLQDILFYRALGVELGQIKFCLDDPAFDRLSALRAHQAALEGELERIGRLIDSVKETIRTQERNEIMSDQKKFEAFKRQILEERERLYGAELREKYGQDQVEQSHRAVMDLTQEQYREWTSLEGEILDRLSAAVAAGADPAGEQGEQIVQLHRRWLAFSDSKYHPAKHRGLAELYVQDERFTAYYDRKVPGCARFLRDAVIAWVK